MDLFGQINNGAIFSECRKYRFALWRVWDKSKPLVMFIGLNPSTANESTDDRTISRVKRFAFDWGYGGVYMLNLFGWVTPYPANIRACIDPVGDNDRYLLKVSGKCEMIVFAWGSFKEAKERAAVVLGFFNGHALVINSDGTPRHPLYVPAVTVPVQYNLENISNQVQQEQQTTINHVQSIMTAIEKNEKRHSQNKKLWAYQCL